MFLGEKSDHATINISVPVRPDPFKTYISDDLLLEMYSR